MKKLFSCMICVVFLLFCSCLSEINCQSRAYKDMMARKETDGQFYYYFNDESTTCTIIGDKWNNNPPATVYFPPYYKEKEVKQIFAWASGGIMDETFFGPNLKNVNKVYIPYTSPKYASLPNETGWNIEVKEVFYPGFEIEDYNNFFHHFLSEYNKTIDITLCLTADAYSELKEFWQGSKYDVYSVKEEHDQKTIYKEKYERYVIDGSLAVLTLKKANVTYCFNYENSPNEGVFFIDDCNYGQKINDTPYKPTRKGYDFVGWYKEKECITEWNFETNTLPTAKYNDDGETGYQETKLYAKWTKK